MQDAEQRTLASDRVNDSEVVTLFLGLDYGSDQPELFETVVKVGSIGPVTKRYPTYQSAIAGHDQIVFRLKSSLDQFLASLEWAGKKAL